MGRPVLVAELLMEVISRMKCRASRAFGQFDNAHCTELTVKYSHPTWLQSNVCVYVDLDTCTFLAN